MRHSCALGNLYRIVILTYDTFPQKLHVAPHTDSVHVVCSRMPEETTRQESESSQVAYLQLVQGHDKRADKGCPFRSSECKHGTHSQNPCSELLSCTVLLHGVFHNDQMPQ